MWNFITRGGNIILNFVSEHRYIFNYTEINKRRKARQRADLSPAKIEARAQQNNIFNNQRNVFSHKVLPQNHLFQAQVQNR